MVPQTEIVSLTTNSDVVFYKFFDVPSSTDSTSRLTGREVPAVLVQPVLCDRLWKIAESHWPPLSSRVEEVFEYSEKHGVYVFIIG